MRRQMHRKDVENDIQSAIRVQIEVANEAKGTLPCGTSASLDHLDGFRRIACRRRVRSTETACELSRQFTVPFRLFTEQIEFVLLVAVAVSEAGYGVGSCYSQEPRTRPDLLPLEGCFVPH